MNERIKLLAENAEDPEHGFIIPEKLIELVVRECANVAWRYTPETEELEYSHLIKDKILEHFGVEE